MNCSRFTCNNGCRGCSITMETFILWKLVVISLLIFGTSVCGLLQCLMGWSLLVSVSLSAIPTSLCFLYWAAVTVSREEVTALAGVGIEIRRSFLLGEMSRVFLPQPIVKGVIVFEAVAMQRYVPRVSLMLGDSSRVHRLITLFQTFRLDMATARNVYTELNTLD